MEEKRILHVYESPVIVTILFEVFSAFIVLIGGEDKFNTDSERLSPRIVFFVALYLLLFTAFYSLLLKESFAKGFRGSKLFFFTDLLSVVGILIVGLLGKGLMDSVFSTTFYNNYGGKIILVILGYEVLYIVVDAIVSVIRIIHQKKNSKI